MRQAQLEPSTAHAGPDVPAPRGPLSSLVIDLLQGGTTEPAGSTTRLCAEADPYGDDLQLALYCAYELHYRGFAGVADRLEWNPSLLAVREALESVFLAALRAEVRPGSDVWAEVDGLLVEPVGQGAETGVSHYLRGTGQWWQLREYVTHRSVYHLKEADPQAWVIPRLHGAAKAALVAVEYDEYGGGRPERMHSRLFAEMMTELGLDPNYGAYLDAIPAVTLAEVNLMSMCGLHRGLRGALVGQFAVVELTSSPGSQRLAQAMRRLGCGPAATEFYDEHVEADAVHEQLIRAGVLTPLLAEEPQLAPDIVFGMRSAMLLAERTEDHLLSHWRLGQSSLRVGTGTPR